MDQRFFRLVQRIKIVCSFEMRRGQFVVDRQRSACIANLKQISGAKATWALEAKKVNADSPADTDLFGSTAYIRSKPGCPANGAYTVDIVANNPACSLSGTEGHTL